MANEVAQQHRRVAVVHSSGSIRRFRSVHSSKRSALSRRS
jgi:hypothetical protein